MIEWLNDNPGAVQASVGLVLALTLAAILWYAAEARKQAKASARMAGEMERARYDSLRPVIDLAPNERRAADHIKQGLDKALPPEMECQLRNIGVGPALNIEFHVYHPQEQRAVVFTIGALSAGECDESRHHHLSLESPQGGQGLRLLRVRYDDVFGRALESWREMSLDEGGELVIGPLRTGLRGSRSP